MDKLECRPSQAADLLTWQWYKDFKRKENGLSKPRGDLLALLSKTRHFTFHADSTKLQELVDLVNAKAGTPIGNEIAGIALKNPGSRLFPKNPSQLGSAEEYRNLAAKFPEKFKSA